MVRLCALAVSALAIVGSASAKSGTDLYVGTVGGKPVVLDLAEDAIRDGPGFYFRSTPNDPAQVETRRRGRQLEIRVFDYYGGYRLASVLRLVRSGATLTGTYAPTDSASPAPVRLHRATAADLATIAVEAPVVERWRRSAPYTALKFDRPFARVRVARLAGRTVTWLREPRSGVRLPRLPGAGPVNDALTDEQLIRARRALECPVPGGWRGMNGISLLTRRVLSLKGYVSAFCGGAHPFGFPISATFDIARGRATVLEDLYRFAPVPAGIDPHRPPGYDAPGYDRWEAYLLRRGAVLHSLARRASPGLDGTFCGSSMTPEQWAFASWHLNARGLVLRGDFARVADLCDVVEFTIPYGFARPYRVATSPGPS
ncbi:MAG: hypothetical protein FJW96_09365 [Actinobacteria bacterium]|nr:hypothetical protein [Actinomycetota bacterium]